MPEAEDVVLESAHRALHGLRSLWRRYAPPAQEDVISLADESRRLGDWLTSCFGRSFAIAPADAPPRPGWLARRFDRPAPWVLRPVAVPCHDGDRIRLPRRLGPEAGDPATRRALLLLAALGLGRRLARRSEAELPADPIARDCFLALEGALGDVWIARAFPGLASALDDARRRARAARPAGQCLRVGAERRVEALVRLLLAGPATAVARELPAPLEPDASPREVAEVARILAAACGPQGACDRNAASRASAYRGVAPVLHWGVGVRGATERTAIEDVEPLPLPLGRRRELRRAPRVRRPGAEEQEARSGPFVLPFGDPALSVQDAAGLVRPPDQAADEDLEGLAGALEELGEAPQVHAPGAVRELLLADEAASARPSRTRASTPEPGLRVFRYPEWDSRRGHYRPDHCRVLEGPAPRREGAPRDESSAARQRLRAGLRRRFEALRPRPARCPRQRDGDELDFDGFVEELADRRAGLAAPGRVYLQERPRRRDVAVTLLLDVSGSTDAAVHGARRVIDVEKEAALGFCEALAGLGDRVEVLAFSGRGSEQVRVWRVKGFDEDLGDAVRARVAGLEPEAFTRLGAALRHAAAGLARERARVRLLLLLSDGKPYDEDDYAGAVGVGDVRQAVAEAERIGVAVFCVTVDREGPHYLPQLFGAGRYTVLSNAEQLPERLADVYRRLTRNA